MVEERGYDITELSEENGYEGYSTKEWLIKKDDMAYICVQIELETDGSGEGLERFWVSYNIEDSSNIGELLQMCEDIIMDLDNKYSLREEDVNYEGNVISRQNFLDYFENWTLTYTVDKSNWENLCFWGLTDNSTR